MAQNNKRPVRLWIFHTDLRMGAASSTRMAARRICKIPTMMERTVAKLEPITVIGNAKMSMPNIIVIDATNCPAVVSGYTSPYPTVVIVTDAQ
eukprot:SAG31_NODE_2861_length_4987_cov_105.905278_7_plen_93_part_00